MLQDKRIFFIEDDPNNVAIISSILRRAGATVYYDFWGYQTAQRITTMLPIDLIALDLMLPGDVDGYQIYQQLREQPELAGIPVIIISAMDPDTEVPKAKELGFNGFIAKPVRSGTLAKMVRAVLDGTPVWVDME